MLAMGCPANTTTETPDGGEEAAPDAGAPEVDAGTPDAGNGEDECLQLELGARDFQTNLFGQLTGVRYAVSPAIDGELTESLILELYDSSTPNLPPLEPGIFDLAAAPNDSLSTCQHCVWLPVDWDGVSPLTKVFVPTEGEITLTLVEDPLSTVFAGSTTELVLREAAVDETGATTLIDGGRCARAPAFTFDTSPSPGRACLSAEDCGNPLLEICSPATYTCAPHECGDLGGCSGDRPVCLVQYPNLSEGACYAACDPTAPSQCQSGQDCVQLGVDPAFGVCMKAGEGVIGDACNQEDTSTSCVIGMTCSSIEQTCTNSCRFFDANPGCEPQYACNVLGVCDPESSGDPAQFGQPCDAAASFTQGCAADSGAFRGICFSFRPEDPLICEEACLGDLGCEPEEFCALRFSSGLGICLPDPVCGDGKLGEIDEFCDDGNTTSGDGCSSDCKTVEYDAICPNAPLLASGANSGDTSTAWDGFQATCQLGTARAELYRFTPASRGRLRLTVNAATGHSISIRGDCAQPGTELACATADFSGTSELIYQVTSVSELSVMVSAFTVLDEGPFTLDAEFTPELCGDGVLAGLEVCDDGNTMSNDGCASDCTAIEYAAYCSQATTLTTSTTGDNTGAPSIYSTSCAGSVLGDGLDRLFHYTAPSAGTVRFRLEPDVNVGADLVLAVFDNCGDPTTMTELGCSSVYEVEQVDLQVTAGQQLTVLVEGFHPTSVSPFTLTAEMLP